MFSFRWSRKLFSCFTQIINLPRRLFCQYVTLFSLALSVRRTLLSESNYKKKHTGQNVPVKQSATSKPTCHLTQYSKPSGEGCQVKTFPGKVNTQL